MHAQTETLPPLRLAAIRPVGPYNQIGQAFRQLHQIATGARLPHRGPSRVP